MSQVSKAFIVIGILASIISGLFPERSPAWAESHQASATLRLVAVVSPRVKLQVLRETTEVVASIEDLDRGYLDVPGAAELLVWTNSPSGLTISASVEGSLRGSRGNQIPITALSYSLDGSESRPFTSGNQVIYAGTKQEVRSLKRISYRLNLDWATSVDIYSINIAYTVNSN